jgi:hypothetical protein
MNLPAELQPTDMICIQRGNRVAELSVCRPVFLPWTGAPPTFDFGSKPILSFDGKACFAELVILRLLLAHGWSGAWIETFGGVHYLRSMPRAWSLKSEHVSLPPDKDSLLRRIWQTAKTTACFDVFAWQGSDVLFCEAKRRKKDKLTDAQLRFVEGALMCGVTRESFLIVEWEMSAVK